VLALTMVAAAGSPPAAQGGQGGQAATDSSIAVALMRDGERHAAPRAVVWVASGALTAREAADFATRLSDGVVALERALGVTLDRARYGTDTVHAFLAPEITVSHVYGGYDHQRHAKPYLFLDPAKVRAREAPYLHETTHLLAWRFGSHSLREGTAMYAEALVGGAGGGDLSGLFMVRGEADADARAAALLGTPLGQDLLRWIGRGGFPDAAVTAATPANRRSRAGYYQLSQSFAQHVAREAGLATLLALYAAPDTEAAYVSLTGRTREAWVEGWVKRVTSDE
jgi:hypothetical protein